MKNIDFMHLDEIRPHSLHGSIFERAQHMEREDRYSDEIDYDPLVLPGIARSSEPVGERIKSPHKAWLALLLIIALLATVAWLFVPGN